ncbi:hypothetical protein L2E82_18344 [Cichorium intybus]|uniref:Uncharacterized protein n=1 Tax=Cichorium intybus TaxID=13427 RepID=A0ACB9FAP8_CICIN|nr:hypothetical protein L2E82_18344 [Cichorium intybus]
MAEQRGGEVRDEKDISSGMNENVEDLEFGRDTNRLDYFRVTSFDVHADQSLPGKSSYGGGGGTRRVPRAIASKDEGEGVQPLRWWETCSLRGAFGILLAYSLLTYFLLAY